MPSDTRLSFLDLPRELRDIIYHHYVFELDGYHFDYETGKLRASNKRRIDLALEYTCRIVAKEMHHLALESNILHFSTVDIERVKAVRFNLGFDRIQGLRSATLNALTEPIFRRYMTSNIVNKVALRFPQFEPLLHLQYRSPERHKCALSQPRGDDSSWGEADSVFRAFQNYIIECLASDSDFPEALAYYWVDPKRIRQDLIDLPPREELDEESRALRDEEDRIEVEDRIQHGRRRGSFLRSDFLWSGLEPWTIPTEDMLAKLDFVYYEDERWEPVKWRFSAAAAAIHFFQTVSQQTIAGIRNVVLHEDRRSVAHPECHTLGLVPFCLQNPKLHLERRVNVWRNLLLRDTRMRFTRIEVRNEMTPDDYNRICTESITRNFSAFLTEAYALSSHGMPISSFSLILDGDPAVDQCSSAFELVKEDAAWQVAEAQWFIEMALRSGLVENTYMGCYMSRIFPQAIKDIVEGKSFVRCNFPTGNMYDSARVLERNRHLRVIELDDIEYLAPMSTGFSWIDARRAYRRHTKIQPLPPLPFYLIDLALEDLITEEEIEKSGTTRVEDDRYRTGFLEGIPGYTEI